MVGRDLVFVFTFQPLLLISFYRRMSEINTTEAFSALGEYNLLQSHIFTAAGSGGNSSGFFHDCFIHTLA